MPVFAITVLQVLDVDKATAALQALAFAAPTQLMPGMELQKELQVVETDAKAAQDLGAVVTGTNRLGEHSWNGRLLKVAVAIKLHAGVFSCLAVAERVVFVFGPGPQVHT